MRHWARGVIRGLVFVGQADLHAGGNTGDLLGVGQGQRRCHHGRTALRRTVVLLFFCCLCLMVNPAPGQSTVQNQAQEQGLEQGQEQGRASEAGPFDGLMIRLAGDGYDPELILSLFAHPDVDYLPDAMGAKMRALYKRKYVPAPKRPESEKPEGPRVYASCVEPQRLEECQVFLDDNRALFQRVRDRYGVPETVAVALLSVETRLGQYLGKDSAFATLASMAVSRDYDSYKDHLKDWKVTKGQRNWLDGRAKSKADWAYAELKALIDHSLDNSLDPVTMTGSIYGAIGICQFMPSNAVKLGVDGDKDGVVDLFNLEDAAHSLANYLKHHGWKDTLSRSRRHKVLYRYNHSNTYANTILHVADCLE